MKIFRYLIAAILFVLLASCDTSPTLTVTPHPFRGTNVAGGEMVYGQANTDNPTSGADFRFVDNADIDYLAKKNIGFLRMVISWEGLQPTLNQPLSTGVYNTTLQARVAYATGKGMNVLLEPHGGSDVNFIKWKGNLVGSAAVPNSAFADFWTRMAAQFKNNPRVQYGLGNEPHDQSTAQWFSAAQAAITGIRSTGSTQMIFVPGNGWTGASSWTSTGPDTGSPKIANSTAFLALQDPAHNLVASVHLYLDANGGGGAPDIVSPTIGVERMTAVVNWAKANNVKVHMSEIGANQSNAVQAQPALKNLFDYIQANNTTVIGWSWWAYGPPQWWAGNSLTLCPPLTASGQAQYTTDNVKMSWLAPYLVQPAPGAPDASVPPPVDASPPIVDASPPSPSFPTNPIAFTKNAVFTTTSAAPTATAPTFKQTNWAFVPNGYDSTHNTPMTLFVWLHGCGGQSQFDVSMVSWFTNQSWISLAVGGREGGCWSGVNTDGAKVLAAIADMKTHFNINPRRVILGGYSSGGDIGYPLVFQNANLFAGALFENTGPGSAGLTAANTAAWKLNIVHLAHLQDTTYPIASTRTNMATLQSKGFPVTLIEKTGGHYDNDSGQTGTQYDLRNFLLPHLDDGWLAPGSTPQPPAACVYSYSAYGDCQPNGTQTRTVTGSTPVPCTVGTTTTTQACVYVPPACVYTYSDWGVCQSSGTQTRTVTATTPTPCTAGTQSLSQVCTFVPPVVDAGPPDTGTPDAGAPDAGTVSPLTITSKVTYDWGSGYCKEFYFTNKTSAQATWSQFKMNMRNGTVRDQDNKGKPWDTWGGNFSGRTGVITIKPGGTPLLPGQKATVGFCADYSTTLPKWTATYVDASLLK